MLLATLVASEPPVSGGYSGQSGNGGFGSSGGYSSGGQYASNGGYSSGGGLGGAGSQSGLGGGRSSLASSYAGRGSSTRYTASPDTHSQNTEVSFDSSGGYNSGSGFGSSSGAGGYAAARNGLGGSGGGYGGDSGFGGSGGGSGGYGGNGGGSGFGGSGSGGGYGGSGGGNGYGNGGGGNGHGDDGPSVSTSFGISIRNKIIRIIFLLVSFHVERHFSHFRVSCFAVSFIFGNCVKIFSHEIFLKHLFIGISQYFSFEAVFR